jgi:hypothetical protein
MSAHTSHHTQLDPAKPVRHQLLGVTEAIHSSHETPETVEKTGETFSFSWFFLIFWLTLVATLLLSWYMTQGIS